MSQLVKLKAVAGKAPYNLLWCPNCENTVASGYVLEGEYRWALKLHCEKCDTKWWVCTQCATMRAHMKQRAQATRHNKKHISKVAEEETTASLKSPPKPSEIATTYFHRKASKDYFNACLSNNGINYLTSMAVFHNSTMMDNLDPGDVKTFMSTAHFVSTITRSQREDLACVLRNVNETTKRHVTSEEMWSTPTSPAKSEAGCESPPRKKLKLETPKVKIAPLVSKQKIRSTIIEGKFSLYQNLAHPLVRTDPTHAYILPSEALADFLAHGLAEAGQEDKLHPVEPLGRSYHGNKIVSENNCKTIFASLWSDGFDPNYTLKTRGSCWIMTICFQSPLSQKTTIHNIYPLIIGKEGDNHSQVVSEVMTDLFQLSKKDGHEAHVVMYDQSTSQNEKLSCNLISISQDQPERREFSGLIGGGSTLHRRYGWIIDIGQVEDRIRPCSVCQKEMESNLEEEWHPAACENCINWMVHPSQVEYTQKWRPGSPTVTMERMTYGMLKEAAELVHTKILNEEWDSNVATTYLKSYNINKKVRAQILKCANNSYAKKKALEQNNNDILEAIAAEEARNPKDYKQWEPHILWNSGLNVHQSHEAAMHELFLGITNSVTFSIQDWASLRRKQASLRRHLEILTVHLEKKHLSWCRVMAYRGDKLGAWISESYLAFARLAPWVYSGIDTLANDAPYVPPNKPQASWTAKENKAWLRARHLPQSGNAAILKARVQEHVAQGTPIPPPVGGPMVDVRQMVIAMWMMTSHLMGMTEGTALEANQANRLIRIFLTKVYDYDQNTAKHLKRKSPMWKSAYNFLCLLNLPEQIKNLGPVRNRWEGSIRGERFIQQVKPAVTSTRRTNWQQNLMKNLLRQRELLILKESAALSENENPEEREDSNAFTTYHTIVDIQADFNDRVPISCILTETETDSKPVIYVILLQNRTRWGMRIPYHGPSKYFFGMWYHPFMLSIDPADHELKRMDELDIKAHSLLLPINQEQQRQEQTYQYWTIVDSRWRAMAEDGRMVQPRQFLAREFEDVLE